MADLSNSPVIIGGGPAGAATAIQLARAGVAVRLFERKREAHHKVCGEFISWEAAQYLQELGLDLQALGAQPVSQFRLYSGEQSRIADLPHTAWSLSRKKLDEALLQEAENQGADVRLGVPVRKFSATSAGWEIDISGATGSNDVIIANAVFLASGKHDVRGRARPHQGHELIGIKMHYRVSKAQQVHLRNAVEIHLFDGGYAGLELVEEGVANLCFLVHKSIYSNCQNQWQKTVERLCQASPSLAARLKGAQPCWAKPLAVYGTPYGYLHKPNQAENGLFKLGDQTAVIPSFAGDGIAIALHSATLAARGYLDGTGAPWYQEQAWHDFKTPVRSARMIEKLLARNPGRIAAFWITQQWPRLLNTAINQVRIPAPALATPRSETGRA